MNWIKSKRGWTTLITAILLPMLVSQGWLTEVMAASVAGLIASMILGDTFRPSGTTGAMGANGKKDAE